MSRQLARYIHNARHLSQRLQLVIGLPADTNDTRRHKLLYLGPDTGVLHVLGQRRRVGLCLLQNSLHHRVLHNRHDLDTVLGDRYVGKGRVARRLPLGHGATARESAPLSRSPAPSTWR